MSVKTFSFFAIRVVIVHTLTYMVAGWIALSLQWGGTYGGEALQWYIRDPTSQYVQTWFIPAQILRAILLAVAFYPFLGRIMAMKRFGWLTVASGYLLIGTLAGSGGTIEDIVYTKVPAEFLLATLPEVVLQGLLFGYLLTLWQRQAKE
ncbi:hypothetical protein [[Eubacterium] cellulosolvens]